MKRKKESWECEAVKDRSLRDSSHSITNCGPRRKSLTMFTSCATQYCDISSLSWALPRQRLSGNETLIAQLQILLNQRRNEATEHKRQRKDRNLILWPHTSLIKEFVKELSGDVFIRRQPKADAKGIELRSPSDDISTHILLVQDHKMCHEVMDGIQSWTRECVPKGGFVFHQSGIEHYVPFPDNEKTKKRAR